MPKIGDVTRDNMQGAAISDKEVADKVRMLLRVQPNHEMICTLARDRLYVLIDEVQKLRKLLAYSSNGGTLYTDDGELQDNSALPFIDYKRMSVDDIEAALLERAKHKLQENL